MPQSALKHKNAPDIRFTLKRVFRKDFFRPLQEDVIRSAIAGEDIFLCAATSFGKSLCYQLPAIVSTGVTIVISPLLALMTNQVNAAKELGIPVQSINGTTGRSVRSQIETDLLCGHPETRLLYITPELCATDQFRRLLLKIHGQGQLVRIAVDEAHCISEWGHDFRPAYKELQWLRATLTCPALPIMAVTATATKQVQDDIYHFLGLDRRGTKSFMTTTARPNIHYEVQYFSESDPSNGEDDVLPYLISWLNKIHQRRLALMKCKRPLAGFAASSAIHGIIYVPLRSTADSLASRLAAGGIRACAYHAGLDPAVRLKIQASFLGSATGLGSVQNGDDGHDRHSLAASFNIICATTAFGMGIDMPTIRFVVHYGLPRGMESFVQESGRAGRDNKAASSLVLYTREEKDRCLFRAAQDMAKEKNKTQTESKMSSLRKIIDFCENTNVCRHELVSRYFSDESTAPPCDFACDVCKEGPASLKRRKERGLATEEDAMQFTQRETIDHYEYE